MATYIALYRWTEKGMSGIKGSPGRLDEGRKVLAGTGVTIKEFYMTMGEYDMLIILDAPDDTTLAKAMLTLASAGNVQGQTFRAYNENEYRQIIGALPSGDNE